MKIKSIILVIVLMMAGGIAAGWSQTPKFYFPQVDWTTGWAAGVRVSTLGPGIEGIKSINANWNARLGVSLLPFQIDRHTTISNLGLDVTTQNRVGGINLQGDFFYKPWFYFTGGVLLDLVQSKVTMNLTDTVQYGDISIYPDQVGTLNARVRPGCMVAPFLGIGLGNPMPVNRKWSFNAELGVIYHGKPDFTMDAEGMLNPSASAHNEKALENTFGGYRFYPLFSMQLNYRIR